MLRRVPSAHRSNRVRVQCHLLATAGKVRYDPEHTYVRIMTPCAWLKACSVPRQDLYRRFSQNFADNYRGAASRRRFFARTRVGRLTRPLKLRRMTGLRPHDCAPRLVSGPTDPAADSLGCRLGLQRQPVDYRLAFAVFDDQLHVVVNVVGNPVVGIEAHSLIRY